MLCTPLHGWKASCFLSPGVDAIHGITYSALNPWETDKQDSCAALFLCPNVTSTLSDIPAIDSVSGLSAPPAGGKST